MPKDVLYGPIQARGYDDITLVVEHEAFFPDGTSMKIPAGTKLVMTCLAGGGGPTVEYRGGCVERADVKRSPAA